MKVDGQYVAHILRSEFGMRYKKVQKTSYQGNSPRSLVLRHLCAKTMLDILNGDMIVINIDESSFIEADFRRQKWRKRQETNSIS